MRFGSPSSSSWFLAAAFILFSTGSATAFLAPGPCAQRPPFAHARPLLRGGGSACSALRMATEKEMETARFAVADAAEACRSVAASLSSNMEEGTLGKKDLSPVTVGDFAVQAIVCKRLMEAFPDDEVIAEENADALRQPEGADLLKRVVAAVQSVEPTATPDDVCDWIDRGTLREYRDRFWTLDPIDGTKGFLRREQYAICLGLVEKGTVTAAAMGCPNLPASYAEGEAGPAGVLLSGYSGGGSYSQPMPSGCGAVGAAKGEKTRLQIKEKDLSALRFCESVEKTHSNHDTSALVAAELGITAPPLRIDSQCKYAVLARGDAEVYLRLPAQAKSTYVEYIWDHAAGVLLLEESGGVVTDMYGAKLDFGHGPRLEKNRGVMASCNPELHRRMVEAVKKHADV